MLCLDMYSHSLIQPSCIVRERSRFSCSDWTNKLKQLKQETTGWGIFLKKASTLLLGKLTFGINGHCNAASQGLGFPSIVLALSTSHLHFLVFPLLCCIPLQTKHPKNLFFINFSQDFKKGITITLHSLLSVHLLLYSLQMVYLNLLKKMDSFIDVYDTMVGVE